MRASASWFFGLLPIALALAAFHFWGEHERARRWWWIGGDSDGMSFVDLLHANEAKGRLLLTSVASGDDAPIQEVTVEWSCRNHTITLGEMWDLDERMQQIDRIPPPPQPDRGPRPPHQGSEQALVDVACATAQDRSKMRTIRIERPPMVMTRLAINLTRAGIRPFDALILSAYDPQRDPEGYERLLARVPAEQRDQARKLAK